MATREDDVMGATASPVGTLLQMMGYAKHVL